MTVQIRTSVTVADAPTSVHVLGALEIRRGEQRLNLGGPAQQVVIAQLIAAHPDAVSVSRLVEAVWGDQPIATQLGTLQAYVSRIRKLLSGAATVEADGHGYRLAIATEAIDVHRFRDGVARGRQAFLAGRFAEAGALLAEARACWRSDQALAGIGEQPWAAAFCAGLAEERIEALLLQAECWLQLNDPHDCIALLEPLARSAPRTEAAVRLLMTALYRDDRQIEALEWYRLCRRTLADELGIEPSPSLQHLHRQVLSQSAELDWQPPEPAPLPRILPVRNRLIVGRESELEEAVRLLAQDKILTIYGVPGIGKTTMAAELGHRQPGLVCWLPAEDATATLNALTELASRLGIPAQLQETELTQRLWQRLAELPDWLLIYDNAENPEALQSLLPPGGEGRIVITSRNAAWAAVGRTIRLGPLGHEAATRFVQRRSGCAGQDPDALAEALDNYPLALEQACRYVNETGMSLDRYVRLFRRRQRDLLLRGAPASHPHPVTATWELVFGEIRHRSRLAATILEVSAFLSADRLPLSALGRSLSRTLAEGVDDLELEDAIAELMRYSIVDRTGSDLLDVHRLVQALVRGQLDPLARLERASQACAVLSDAVPGSPTAPEHWPDWSALTPHVLALFRAAGDARVLPAGAVALALECLAYLRSRSALEPARELIDVVIDTVETADPHDHQLGELFMHRADILDATGLLTEARDELQHALAVFDRRPDLVTELTRARTWARLAHVLNCGDEPAAAQQYYQQALAILRLEAEVAEVVDAMIGLAYVRWSQNDYAGAAAELRAALDLMTGPDWTRHPTHPDALSGLGMMLHELGQVEEAIELQHAALAEMIDIYGDIDHPSIAYTCDKLGYEYWLTGDHERAVECHGRAVQMLGRLFGPDDPRLAIVVSNLGRAQEASGRIEEARRSQIRAHAVLLAHYGGDHRDTKLVATRVAALSGDRSVVDAG